MVQSEESIGSDWCEYIIFTVGETRHALPVHDVREINRNAAITPVLTAADYVCGVMNLRGQIVTVLNLARKLGVERSDKCDHKKNLIVQSEGELVGLLVDDVEDIVRFDLADVLPPPAPAQDSIGRSIQAVIQMDDALVGVLDVDWLVNENATGPRFGSIAGRRT